MTKPSLLNLILPENIKTTEHFWNTFGQAETEISARWIVRFLKEERPLQGWVDFKHDDLQKFYNRSRPGEVFLYNRLLALGCLTLIEGIVHVNARFVGSICTNADLITG